MNEPCRPYSRPYSPTDPPPVHITDIMNRLSEDQRRSMLAYLSGLAPEIFEAALLAYGQKR